MLAADGITVTFGGVRAVDEVSLEVSRAELLGLVGPNGSGKTTFLNALCGLVPAQGTLTVDDRPVRLGRPPSARRAGIGRVFQTPQIFDDLSCLENVLLASASRSWTGFAGAWLARPAMWRGEHLRWAQAMEALELVGLAAYATGPAGLLSYGQRRLLELARALAGKPQVLLLDEPSAGLNDSETSSLAELLKKVQATGSTLIVVDHKIDFLDALCDRLVVLELGRVIARGRPADVWRDDRVISAYLGVPAAEEASPEHRPLLSWESGKPSDVAPAASPGETLLQIDAMHVRYGTTHAVRGIDLTVQPGEAVALLGPNGAGKTSTLRAISRLVPYTGSVTFDGADIARSAPEDIARRGLIHVPEGRHIFPDLSVHENLQLGMTAQAGRTASFSLDDVYDLFPALAPLRDRLGFALSGGEQQMVAIGRALLAGPRLLLIDEPSLGLAPVVADAVAGALQAVRSRTALLIIEQNVHLAVRVCDRAAVMSNGEIVLRADAARLHDRDSLLASYLGQTRTGTGA